jgi:hypothetical protein
MSEMIVNKSKFFYFSLLSVIGLTLRMYVSGFGHNYDYDSWVIVSNLFLDHQNIYEVTARYNYGPVWFFLLGLFGKMASILNMLPGQTDVDFFRWTIVIFLSLCDLGIAYFLYSKFGLASAALLLLNPISIIITGYHNQFDNLAILLGLVGVIFFEKKKFFYGALWIGFSLVVKHLLFIYPLWLWFKYKRIDILFLPYIIFALSFLFFLPKGYSGILTNVFLYQSLKNYPLMKTLGLYLNGFDWLYSSLFFLTLAALGWFLRFKNAVATLLLYCAFCVSLSTAIANQYLAIPSATVSAMPNIANLTFMLLGSVFLIGDANGLGYGFLNNPYLTYGTLSIFLILGAILAALSKD